MIIPLTRLAINTALVQKKGEPQQKIVDHITYLVKKAEDSALTELLNQFHDINLKLKETYPGYSIYFEYHD